MRNTAVYIACAVLIAVGLFLGVNGAINAQTDVLRGIKDSADRQVATGRALACTLTLPIGPMGRDPKQAAACWTDEGLAAPATPKGGNS